MKEKKNKVEVNEPGIPYSSQGKKRITFFRSHEEAELATLRERMRMTPEQRIAMVTEMLTQLYAEELSRPKPTRRIIFHS